MTGFSRQEQDILAALILMHRRKLRLEGLNSLENPEVVWRLAVLLRLSVLLHHNRSSEPLPAFTIGYTPQKRCFKVCFPDDWLDQHPLIRADLKAEAALLKAAGLKLKFC